MAARAFLPFISPVLRQSESLRLAVGEQDGTAFGRAHLVARSSETAGQIRTALEGVVAMARLQTDSDPLATKALDGIKVIQADRAVDVQWRVPVGEVTKLLETDWAKQAKPQQVE